MRPWVFVPFLLGCAVGDYAEPSDRPDDPDDVPRLEDVVNPRFKPPPMRQIPAGDFYVGCHEGVALELLGIRCQADEKFRREHVDAFSIDVDEVTQYEYRRCVLAKRCTPPSMRDPDDDVQRPTPYKHDLPVVYVSWRQAREYCQWRGTRLPTELEWERAARGDIARLFPWGSALPTCRLANFEGCGGELQAVTSHPEGVSADGLYDMAGNAWEWVEESPGEDFPHSMRVIRGGNFNSPAELLRTSYRGHLVESFGYPTVGFRCATSRQVE
ncbi:MAG: SUMF1/EgtB/PvdO family nonheme iron enzyme [Deltaproteobacteria bacterium]|nr:SUMF1/EgtB/PvdO family nonheme iron enzyme [Deltaproteobacteria bacterium]